MTRSWMRKRRPVGLEWMRLEMAPTARFAELEVAAQGWVGIVLDRWVGIVRVGIVLGVGWELSGWELS